MMEGEQIGYKAIVRSISGDVRGGKYSSDGRLPSLTQIMRRFKVSRMTAVRAMDELKRRGLVVSRKGKGAYLSLRARRLGGSLGLIVPGLCYAEIFPPICQRLSQFAQSKGLNLLYGDAASSDPAERAAKARALARRFASEKVLGVFFQPIEFLRDSERINREILNVLTAAGIAVVLLDSDIVAAPERSEFDLVGINNFDAGRRLGRHLLEQGARRLAFVKSRSCDFSVRNRCEGLRNAALSAEVSFVELDCDTVDVGAVKRALAGKRRPDAVVCRNDHQAAHLLVTLRRLGVRVPDDLFVAGFNDVAYASILDPALTTIRVPCEEIAQASFSALWSRIETPSLAPRECYLPAPLVIRASTKRREAD